MNILKPLLVGIFGLFIVVTLISLFIPSRINTIRAVPITASRQAIMTQVAVLENWKNWHPVFKEAANNISILPGTKNGLQEAAWSSRGHESRIVMNKIDSTAVYFTLVSGSERPSDHVISIQPTDEPATQQVQWQSITHLRWYPWEKFSGIFIEKISGPGYEEALNSLKAYAEK